ncbi:Mitochondrial proton/calcium exchanger protein [Heracleum sosnowskyi]|uniref:Mitochondrial proton/calcium exchanger protein n=1 Tax=Heracleum sosnowskyi TaxID=360622 RepID=A0AAD8J4A5_9APIA|nr:Mitochondrial proton/calcium exchanger protein [Heracleum sosnowskyi]
MACQALLRRKNSFVFSGQSAAVLLFGSRVRAPPPFQHCNANNLLRPYSSIPIYPTNPPSIKPHYVSVRHFSTPTSEVVTDSDDDSDWVSQANGSRSKNQKNFLITCLSATCTNIFNIGRFLVHAPFMSRLDWLRWREDMGIYLTWLLATIRFNKTYLRAHVTVTGRLLLKLCWGESLSIKERKLLSRTTAELLRIAPRATNISLPFVEFLLPHFHTLFRILPSPFLRTMKQQEAARKKLKARFDYANFLQDTAGEMALVAQNSESGGIQKTADEYFRFASRCLQGKLVSNAKILRFAKLFNDEITLDNISRSCLMNMCKCIGITPYGSDDFVRFMLRERLKSIKKGDELIQEKGVESLSEDELHKVCRERGINSGEEMHQQLRDWLDLSLRHSIPSSLLILSRDYIVSGKKCEEAILDALCSLPDDLRYIVGATFLPSNDSIIYKHRKLESLDVQEKQIKEEERELSKLTQSDNHTTLDVAFKEMTIPTANGASGARLCDLSNADAILVSALSLKMESEKFVRLINEEIHLCNSVQDNEGADGEKEAKNAQRGGMEMNNLDSEVYVNLKVSSLLRNRADAMFRKIDHVDAKIDERWRDLERYCDGKVDLEVVAAAALYLKDAFDKEGIQELTCNHSKYKEEIMKLSTEAELCRPSLENVDDS